MSSPTESQANGPPARGAARRALRFWAVMDLAHAALVAWLAVRFVPWKLPAANLALLTYAALGAAGAWPLAHGRRGGWRLAVATSLLALVAATLVTTGLVASWAYLRAIHGVFGQGASVVALFLAACAFQVLGLYPALRLRALLRADVRALVEGRAAAPAGAAEAHGRRAFPRGPAGLAFVLVLLPPAAALGVHARFALSPLSPVPEAGRAAALAYVRTTLAAGEAAAPARTAARDRLRAVLGEVPAGPGPVFLQLFARGRVVARVTGGTWEADEPPSLATAIEQAAEKLALLPGARAHADTRIKLDRTVALGPLPDVPGFLLALSLDPGRDGLRTRADPGAPALLPDDILAADAYGTAPLLPFLDEVRLGIDAGWLRARLGNPPTPRWQRFRTESWMGCDEDTCAVERGRVTRPTPPSPADAARAASAFIQRMQDGDGRFAYQYLPHADATPPGPYNLPRHAGTAYSLAMAAAALDSPEAGAAADRAIAWASATVIARPCGPDPARACVVEPGTRRAHTGASALLLLALCARLLHVPDRAQEDLARGLAAHLVALQKPNGDFFHVYLLDEGGPDRDAAPHMFASEEAAFALVQSGRALQSPALLDAAGRALDYLTGSAPGQKYDYFLGRFTFGVDSWTCMAAEAAHHTGRPELQRRAYLDFCLGYADFLRRLQFAPGEAAPEYAGHYGFSALLVPQAPAAAGFTEALGAVVGLARRHGWPVPDLERQLALALAALARDQLGADGTGAGGHLTLAPERAAGGIRRSFVQSEVRIDFVQHALSAFLRGV